MFNRCWLCLFLFALPMTAAEPREITLETADARLRRAFSLAKETNDTDVMEKVLSYRDGVKRAFKRRDMVAAERLIRDAEQVAGLDAGGESMLGLPVAQIDPTLQKKLDGVAERLEQAMNGTDLMAVRSIVAEGEKLLGTSAGVPDLRRQGDKTKVTPAAPKEVAELFLSVLQIDPRSYKALASGKPVGDTLPRGYASVVDGCLLIRPLVQKHFPDKLEVVDRLIAGCCQTLMSLQTKEGFFKFPDLRGKNTRFGEMIEKVLMSDQNAIEDGWMVVADPEGGSQFDAGECGTALLRAGMAFKNEQWTQAGLKAANWAKSARLVANFNYNAFSVSLLCEAFRATKEQAYLDAAWKKFQFGVGPGQAANGRWLDPHIARTAYHLILVRSLHDLLSTLPAGTERTAVEKAARSAVISLVEEAEKLGAPATSLTVQELHRHTRLTQKSPTSIRELLELAASSAVRRCSSGGRIRPGSPLPELAAAAFVWEK